MGDDAPHDPREARASRATSRSRRTSNRAGRRRSTASPCARSSRRLAAGVSCSPPAPRAPSSSPTRLIVRSGAGAPTRARRRALLLLMALLHAARDGRGAAPGPTARAPRLAVASGRCGALDWGSSRWSRRPWCSRCPCSPSSGEGRSVVAGSRSRRGDRAACGRGGDGARGTTVRGRPRRRLRRAGAAAGRTALAALVVALLRRDDASR